MRKIILLGIVLLLFLGFAPYHELNNLGVIDVMGLEMNNGKYVLYLNVINDKNKVYTITGDSLGEVFLKAKNINNKKTYYNHLEIVVFNTNVINKKVINFFKDEFTSIDYLVLSYDGNISNLFNMYHKRNDYKSFIKKEKNETGSIINVTFKDLLSDTLDEFKTANIPLINVDNNLTSIGLYLPSLNYKVDANLARASYLLNNKISSYSEKVFINNNYYEVFLYNLKSSIKYNNKSLNIKITGKIDSPDSDNLTDIEKQIKNSIHNDIYSLIDDEKIKKYNISNIINYIYLKNSDSKDKKGHIDSAFSSYKNSNIYIDINLDKERKNNYD